MEDELTIETWRASYEADCPGSVSEAVEAVIRQRDESAKEITRLEIQLRAIREQRDIAIEARDGLMRENQQLRDQLAGRQRRPPV